ncbi:hypothetical protein GCM10010503_16160 [Streptomyces lucensis JCM 4490]|uniref:Uncharacterized protein n=1 Tax=Streptomyces lucensis JCM 4490 TaxID=1306176 RepID=A0A918MNX2_9ACTN|nr:hypothetical protein GCM10010503_16160 [Streptomyces lucensis JCM 4490]
MPLGFFHHERARALASLEVIGPLDAGALLPGHGPLHRGPVRAAAGQARERATRNARARP